MKHDPNSTMPVGQRTLPPEFTPAAPSGRADLIARYGSHAGMLYEDFMERGRVACEAGYTHTGLALYTAAAFWRRVLEDQQTGRELLGLEDSAA